MMGGSLIVYTTDDDGIHLECPFWDCNESMYLGYDATVDEAVEREAEHMLEAHNLKGA